MRWILVTFSTLFTLNSFSYVHANSVKYQYGCALIPAAVDLNYYQKAYGKTGAGLHSALNAIVKTGAHKFTYKQAWDQLRYTDEDPCNTQNVILLYSGRSAGKNTNNTTGSWANKMDAWDREHVWAKSHGFPKSSRAAYTDLHHLRPADHQTNMKRSNKDFAEGGDPFEKVTGVFTTATTWEPPDTVKGDVARMIFYMGIRYEGDTKVPDLTVVEGPTQNATPKLGDLCTLYRWHEMDFVDHWEVNRNNRIHERQGNRNPFIDHPEWVQAIWGSKCRANLGNTAMLIDQD